MADFWQNDPVVQPGQNNAPAGQFWANDEVVGGQETGPLDRAATFARGLTEGIPVIGPLAQRGTNWLYSNVKGAVTGQDPAEVAQQLENYENQTDDAFWGERLAGNIAGGLGSFGALGSTQLGQKALGLTGPMLQRALMGGTSGATIAAAHTGASGGGINDQLLAALTGGVLGSAFPFAERGASNVARALAGKKLPAWLNVVNRGATRDGLNPRDIPRLMDELGPEAVLADLGPNMTRQAAAAASLPGEAQTSVRNALAARQGRTNQRIQASADEILGPAPTPSRLEATIREGQQALSPEYEAVLRNARAVDTTALANNLDAQAVNLRGDAQRAVMRVREMLDIAGAPGNLDPNPATLLQTRQAIDGLLGVSTDRNVIGALSQARREVDEILTRSVPGIKDVDARFAELARQNEAVTEGQRMLESGRTAPRPDEVAEQVTRGALPEGTFIGPSGVPFRLSQGARAEIDRIIGITGNNLTALKSALKGDGSWNRSRLASLFGQEKADRLLDVLEREMTFNRTFSTVMQNSETAARQAAMRDLSPTQFGDRPTGVVDILLRAPQAVANAAARTRSENVNQRVVQALMSRPSPEFVDQLLVARALAERPGRIAPAVAPLLLTNQPS